MKLIHIPISEILSATKVLKCHNYVYFAIYMYIFFLIIVHGSEIVIQNTFSRYFGVHFTLNYLEVGIFSNILVLTA